jgi:hypothetical protein
MDSIWTFVSVAAVILFVALLLAYLKRLQNFQRLSKVVGIVAISLAALSLSYNAGLMIGSIEQFVGDNFAIQSYQRAQQDLADRRTPENGAPPRPIKAAPIKLTLVKQRPVPDGVFVDVSALAIAAYLSNLMDKRRRKFITT